MHTKLETENTKLTIQEDDRFSWEDPNGNAPYERPDVCRGCGSLILSENRCIADGCPCNSPRGINHGLVPKNTCTCKECDPAGTGSTRISETAKQFLKGKK